MRRLRLALGTFLTVALVLIIGTTGDASPVSIATVSLPRLSAVERGEYRALDARTRTELWRTHWELRQDDQGGRPIVRVTEVGSGVRGGTASDWTVSMQLSLARADRWLSSKKEVRNRAGAVVQVQQRELNYSSGTGHVVTIDTTTGHEDKTTFAVPHDGIGIELLTTQLRVLPDVPGGAMRFDLVTRDGKVVPMTARIVGRETVTTPAGVFDCDKIELSVNGFLGQAAKLFLPRMYLWHTTAAPHMWVRYQGLDGGPGAPEVVMELTRFEATTR